MMAKTRDALYAVARKMVLHFLRYADKFIIGSVDLVFKKFLLIIRPTIILHILRSTFISLKCFINDLAYLRFFSHLQQNKKKYFRKRENIHHQSSSSSFYSLRSSYLILQELHTKQDVRNTVSSRPTVVTGQQSSTLHQL